MNDHEILLETGTNEIEILEILVGNQKFGINVLKVKHIMQYDPALVTPVPQTHPSILGNFSFHGDSTSLINLRDHLNIDEDTTTEDSSQLGGNGMRKVILICEFNKLVSGFLLGGVENIFRVSWEKVKPASPVLTANNPKITGIAEVGDYELFMLDFESIVEDIVGQFAVQSRPRQDLDRSQNVLEKRQEIKLAIVDDSKMVREYIEQNLEHAKYTHITQFSNGIDAYNYIHGLQEKAVEEGGNVSDHLVILITDIEMPGMDGFTLCKRIKEAHPDVFVLVFSSLISAQTELKCKEVNADGCLSKKDMPKLITMIDELCI